MTFVVNTLTDETDVKLGDGICAASDGKCSLRAAIQETNAWPGADVIRLPAGTYQITIPGISEDRAATGDLDVTDDLTINGASGDPGSADATIVDGNSIDRVFDVVPTGVTLSLSNLVVENGQTGQASTLGGAGILNQGNLNLTDVTIRNNNNNASGGGGLTNEQGDVHISYSTIKGNKASSFGGVLLTFGSMTIAHSTITANTAGSGGGVGVNGGTMTITDSSIVDNIGAATQGGNGGGISTAGTLKVFRSLISGNTGAQGGGIANTGTGTATIINSTIDGNISQSGGGIANTVGSIMVINSTISHNHASGSPTPSPSSPTPQGYGGGIFVPQGKVSLLNTIVAANVAPNVSQTEDVDCSDGTNANTSTVYYPGGQIVSGGYNLDDDGSCLTAGNNRVINGPGDLASTAPGFATGSPGYNGGPTKTVALTSGSAAIDHVPAAYCKDQNGQSLTQDQRGFVRPVNGACDIGAVEARQSTAAAADLSVHATASPNPVNPNGTLTYTVMVTNNGPDDAGDVTLTDVLPANLSIDSATSPQGTCSSASGTVTCSFGAVPVTKQPTDVRTATITATLPPSATGTLTSKASVKDQNTTDPNSSNDSFQTDTPVNLTGELQTTVTASPNPAVLNKDNVTFTITVTYPNGAGTATVPGVKVIDKLPANASLVTNSTTLDGNPAAGGACTENAGAKTIVCNLGPSPDYTMAPGDSHTITFAVKPGVAGTITDVATANFNGTDSNPANNQSSADAKVVVKADLGLTITDNPDPVEVNNDLVYILNVINNGPSPSSDVKLTATLPANVTFDYVNSSRGTSSCNVTGTTLDCDLQAMADGAQATVTVFVTPTVVGSLQFSGTVSIPSTETDPVATNNTAATGTTVTKSSTPTPASADLAIALTSSPNPVTAGEALTYTLKVSNNITAKASDDASNVIAVLTLPASVKVTSPGSGCTKDSSTNVVRCDLGTVAAGKSTQATVGVAPSQAGIVTASASVNFVGTDPDKTNNTATTSTTVKAATTGSGNGGNGKGGTLGIPALCTLLMLYAGSRRRRRI